MRAWNDFADQYGTDKALADLDGAQIEAVVDLLLIVMYADGKISVMETMELDEALDRLPAIADKRDVANARLAEGKTRIDGADAATVEGIAKAAAAALPAGDVRRIVFEMCATMAHADIQLAADESSALGVIAGALGIDAAAAKAIVDAQG